MKIPSHFKRSDCLPQGFLGSLSNPHISNTVFVQDHSAVVDYIPAFHTTSRIPGSLQWFIWRGIP